MTRPKILLALPEYRVDEQMGGIGVRALDLATALSLRADVTLICNQPCDVPDVPCPVLAAGQTDVAAHVTTADAVIFFDLGDPALLRQAVQAKRFIIVENAVPLEHLEYNADMPPAPRADAYRGYIAAFRAQVAVADHFLARSQIERRLLWGALATEGRLAPSDLALSRELAHLVTHVPIGITRRDAELPVSSGFDPDLFLWTGGLWDYMNYDAALTAFSTGLRGKRLRFMYRPPQDQPLRAHAVLDTCNLSGGAVSFLDTPPLHSQRGAVVSRANALVCLGHPGIENATCVRLRLRDTLLYERPIIVDLHGATGEYVRDTGIGLALPSPDAQAVRAAVLRLSDGSETRAACVDAIRHERTRSLIDDNLTGLFAAGARAGWRATRATNTVLNRLDQIVPETQRADPAPFLT